MKQLILSVITVSLLFLAACKSKNSDPKAVLTTFFAAIAKKDFTTVKSVTTKDSEGMMGMMQMAMQNMSDTTETDKFSTDNMEIGDAVINGDVATVPIKEKKSGETTDFTLKKEDGAWKVAFDKSTLMGIAQKKMKEHGMGAMGQGMSDSLGNLNGGSMPNMDSVSKETMARAKKMMDSVNAKLQDAK